MRTSAPVVVMERPPERAYEFPARTRAEGREAESSVAAGEHRHAFTVPPVPESTRAARQQVVEALRRWGVDGASEAANTVRLIVSELVTNAVRHAGHVTTEAAPSSFPQFSRAGVMRR